MKFSKKKTYENKATIIKHSAPKGQSFLIYVGRAEKELSKSKISKMKQGFDNSGHVCIMWKNIYKVYEEGVFSSFYLTKKQAIKHAKDYVRSV